MTTSRLNITAISPSLYAACARTLTETTAPYEQMVDAGIPADIILGHLADHLEAIDRSDTIPDEEKEKAYAELTTFVTTRLPDAPEDYAKQDWSVADWDNKNWADNGETVYSLTESAEEDFEAVVAQLSDAGYSEEQIADILIQAAEESDDDNETVDENEYDDDAEPTEEDYAAIEALYAQGFTNSEILAMIQDYADEQDE